jgi:hypothetical protein
MSTTDQTWDELAESLNYFDEIAITNHFHIDVYGDYEAKPVVCQRALVFVDQRRQGLKDNEAAQFAKELTFKQLTDYCAVDDEITPEDPETESGKGVSAPAA